VFLIAPALLTIRLASNQRVRDASLFLFSFAAPLLLWVIIIARFNGGTQSIRSLNVHLPSLEMFKSSAGTVVDWFTPEILPTVVKVALTAGLLGGLTLLAVALRKRLAPVARDLGLWLVSGASYCIVLLLTTAFLDSATPLSGRLLAPLLPIVITLLLVVFARLFQPDGDRRAALAALFTFIVLFLGIDGLTAAAQNYSEGVGVLTRRWRDSKIVASLREYEPNVVLYTNKYEQLEVILERDFLELPRPIVNERANPDYGQQIAALNRALAATSAYLVVIKTDMRDPGYFDASVVDVPLKIVFEAADGIIYETKPVGPAF
jgi:hypothetical protein